MAVSLNWSANEKNIVEKTFDLLVSKIIIFRCWKTLRSGIENWWNRKARKQEQYCWILVHLLATSPESFQMKSKNSPMCSVSNQTVHNYIFLLHTYHSTGETIWKFFSGLLFSRTSESSKNQPSFVFKKADGPAFRSAELQKSARKFSHGLNF